MSTSFVIALQLTAVGMGMTFLAIGALTLGMYAMTRLTREKVAETAESAVPETVPDTAVASLASWAATDRSGGGDSVTGSPDDDRRRQAAAAAVAVALAQTAGPKARQGAPQLKSRAGGGDAWTYYVRGLHLSRRARHDLGKGQ